MKIKNFIYDSENKYLKFLYLSSLIGILVGLNELCFAISLKDLIVYNNLIDSEYSFFNNIVSFNPVIIFLFICFLKFLFIALNYYMNAKLREKVSHETRNQLTKQIYFFENKLLNFSNINSITSYILSNVSYWYYSLSLFLSQTFLVLITILFSMYISFSFFLTLVFFSIFLFTPLIVLRKKMNKQALGYQSFTENFQKKMIRDFRNLIFLKISGQLKHEGENLIKTNNNLYKNFHNFIKKISLINQIPFLITAILIPVMLYFNKNFIYLSEGDLVVLAYLVLRMGVSIGSVFSSFTEVKFKFPFVEEINRIKLNYSKKNKDIDKDFLLSFNNKKIDDLKVHNLIIKEHNLNKKIDDFKIKKGDTLFITGSSGSGKSSLLLTIIGINQKYLGEVHWNNINLTKINSKELFERIAFCSSEPYLINGTLEENLYYGVKKTQNNNSKELINKILTITNCDFLLNKNNYLNINITDEGNNFSNGQKQRISLTRALLKNPDVLILDEAMSNIDLENEEQIFNNIRKFNKELIILIVSHRKNIKKISNLTIDLSSI